MIESETCGKTQDAQLPLAVVEVGPGPFEIDQIVGGAYAIRGVLGVGGMGVVYDAEDLVLRRRVALKAPLATALGPALRREAQALAALPPTRNFATVHAFARHGDVDFIVMERLVGETLEARLDELHGHVARMPIEEILRILSALAEALSAAHGVGISARDLKPSNVMLTGDRIVLFDLGLVVPEVLVAKDNDISGTAEYIAPEVLSRRVERGFGPLVDLYALGVVAFELITGATPFASDSLDKTLAGHVGKEAPRADALRDDVPSALVDLVAELLAKDAEGRPAGAEAVFWQLEAITAGARRTRPTRVLAIDDDAHVGTALRRSLEAAFPGMVVSTSTNPREALANATTLEPDVVVVDLAMPGLNGLEVCMQLQSLPAPRRPVVVAMSAQATDADIAVRHELGVAYFVPKDDAFVSAMGAVVGHVRRAAAVTRLARKSARSPQ